MLKNIFFLILLISLTISLLVGLPLKSQENWTLEKEPVAFLGVRPHLEKDSFDLRAFSEFKRLWLQKNWKACFRKAKLYEKRKTKFNKDYNFVALYCLAQWSKPSEIAKYLPSVDITQVSFSEKALGLYSQLALSWFRWASKSKKNKQVFNSFYKSKRDNLSFSLINLIEGKLEDRGDNCGPNTSCFQIKSLKAKAKHISSNIHAKNLIKFLKQKRDEKVHKALSLKLFYLLRSKKSLLKNNLDRLRGIYFVGLDTLILNYYFSDRFEETRKICDVFFKETSFKRISQKATFYCARNYSIFSDYKKSEKLFEKVVKKGKQDDFLDKSLYFNFLIQVRLEKHKKVLSFSENLQNNEYLIEKYGSTIYYWLYTSAVALKKDKQASHFREKLNFDFPLTYYNLKLNKHLGLSNPFSDFSDEEKMPKIFKDRKEDLQRLSIFWKSGCWRLAGYEIGTWSKPKNSNEQLFYSYAYALSFNYVKSFVYLRKAWEDSNEFRKKYWLKMYFPIYFKSYVIKRARKFELPAGLIYGIIRQESAFGIKAESTSGAKGLMQLMPFVGKEMAAYRKLRYSSELLENPKHNIHLGSYYFRRLLNALKDKGYALASYNAGIGRFRKWEKHRVDEIASNDLWMDELPWSETAFYVKSVLRNEAIYQQLYGLK